MSKLSQTRSLSIPLLVLLGVLAPIAYVVGCGDSNDNPNPPPDAGNDVVDETITADAPTESGPDAGPVIPTGNVDRLGRAAIIELLVSAANKDGYNRSDPLDLGGFGGLTSDQLAPDFQAGLVKMDLIDSVDNWEGGSPNGDLVPNDAGPDADASADAGSTLVYNHPLIPYLVQDTLVVDTSKPFSTTSYLDIEVTSIVTGTPGAHTTCGGRWLGDDVVDKTASLLVKKSLTGVSDGVSAATKPPTLTFPYLAPPN